MHGGGQILKSTGSSCWRQKIKNLENKRNGAPQQPKDADKGGTASGGDGKGKLWYPFCNDKNALRWLKWKIAPSDPKEIKNYNKKAYHWCGKATGGHCEGWRLHKGNPCKEKFWNKKCRQLADNMNTDGDKTKIKQLIKRLKKEQDLASNPDLK